MQYSPVGADEQLKAAAARDPRLRRPTRAPRREEDEGPIITFDSVSPVFITEQVDCYELLLLVGY